MKAPLSWPCPQLTPVSSLCLMGTLVGSGLLALSRTLQALILLLQEHTSLIARPILCVCICPQFLPVSGLMVSTGTLFLWAFSQHQCVCLLSTQLHEAGSEGPDAPERLAIGSV